MRASRGGEKGKEASGDTGAGLRAGNELGPTAGTTAQSREEDKEEMTDWGGVGGGRWAIEIVSFFGRSSKYQKTSWAGQVRIYAFNSKPNLEMFLSVYSTPSIVGGQCCSGPAGSQAPPRQSREGAGVLSPGSPHAHLSLYPPPPPSNQAQAIPPTLLVFRILAASRLTLHFEPASPLHRENQRITETGEGTTPTPVAQQGCKETKGL